MSYVSRPHISLDGSWKFRTDAEGQCTPDTPGTWRTLDVPGPWQAQAEDLRTYQGVAWYQQHFEIPSAWAGQHVFLQFGAVDYEANIWVNGTYVGDHVGGYLPFEFDVTDQVASDRINTVSVRVLDPNDNREHYTTPFSEIPHGKQSWYGPLSGIWQSVALEARPAAYISALCATPDARAGTLLAELTLSAATAPGSTIVLTLFGPDGQPAAEGRTTVQSGQARLVLSPATVTRWDLDSPALYTLSARLLESQDQVTTRVGFRTFEARDGMLWLNDRPLMLRGALDQDYYPEGICTPPSYEFLLHQAQLAKRMGLNCLRCHIKIPDPRYLAAADEVGLLIWAELPNWNHWTPEGGARGVATLLEMIARDWNHPSVVIWTVINESWGIDQNDPQQRAWLRSAFEQVKAAAGDRLVVDNSACHVNYHLKSDLDDYHFYAAMPDERARWREWVAQFAARPRWSYGAELPPIPAGTERWQLGDAGFGAPLPEVERSGQEPLLVSEFGNWGLPSLADLRGPSGRDPWWFETGDDWGDGVVYPHGIEQRFTRLGLQNIFGDYERFAAATRRAELDALRFEIEEMRRYPSISGYVITEFTDVHWECNGLLDMRRNPKMALDALAALNADTVLIPDRSGRALWCGEQRRIALHCSHWGAQPLATYDVRVKLFRQQQGKLEQLDATYCTFHPAGSTLTPATTALLGEIALSAPMLDSPASYNLRVELWASGRLLAWTQILLPVYPRQQFARRVYLQNEPALRETLVALGYSLAEAPGAYPTITTYFDAELRDRAFAGERIVVLAEESEALAASPFQVRARAGTPWQGSWASSFAWMPGAWPGDGILDAQFLGIMPTHVVTGVSQQNFPFAVDAGLAVGWLHKPVALTASWYPGLGSVRVTTMRLANALPADPVAQWTFEHILEYTSAR